jgi:hypothetical protein
MYILYIYICATYVYIYTYTHQRMKLWSIHAWNMRKSHKVTLSSSRILRCKVVPPKSLLGAT